MGIWTFGILQVTSNETRQQAPHLLPVLLPPLPPPAGQAPMHHAQVKDAQEGLRSSRRNLL